MRLTISKAGEIAYDEPVRGRGCDDACLPFAFGGERPLKVADLSGDGDPEVVLRLHTGGAHCCFFAEVFQRRGQTYDLAQRNFGDGGVEVADLDGDGTAELRSADGRFAYRFTAYAYSRLPVQVWEFRNRRFADRTRSYPRVLRRDTARWWRQYTQHRGRGEVRGAFAAWAADAARQGQARKVKRALAKGVKRGWFPSVFGDAGGRAYSSKLWRFLGRAGYR